MQGLIDQVHQQFITAVKTGRGKRLKDSPDIFSGLVWTGENGIKLGLADAIGDNDTVATKIIGAEKQVSFTRKDNILDKLAGKMGASFGQAIGSFFQGSQLR
jgi:protease-4